ncbi:MAG: GTP-binding protein [Thermoplasmata archaeon]|nr:GTP-binding protein [Thermoplasmata archaeon]
MPDETIKKNIILLGDGAVGKTSLIRRFVTDQFSDKYITTIGSKVTKKEIYLDSGEDRTHMVLLVWDILGQKGYRFTQALSFGGIEGALLVADLTRKDTLQSLVEYWIPSLVTVTGPLPMIFLGNKCDLEDEAQFGIADLEALAKEYNGGINTGAFTTSAKTGENVENTFVDMATILRESTMEAKTDMDKSGYIIDLDDITDLVGVADHIIADFCNQYGGIENATPVVKHQVEVVGLDLDNPTKKNLVALVNALANAEESFKPRETINMNRTKRLYLINRF